MFGWLKKRRERQFEAYIAARDAGKAAAAAIEHTAKLQREEELRVVAKKLEDEKDEHLKNSDEPWVKIESHEISDTGAIRMKLDWNAAFIRYLKQECNFTGSDDEHIVQKYLGALYHEIYEDGTNKALDLFKNAVQEQARSSDAI